MTALRRYFPACSMKGTAFMKKSKRLLVIFIVVLILVFPVRNTYKDGGTKTYTSLTYKVIVWNELEGKRGTEIHVFPDNFRSLSYFARP